MWLYFHNKSKKLPQLYRLFLPWNNSIFWIFLIYVGDFAKYSIQAISDRDKEVSWSLELDAIFLDSSFHCIGRRYLDRTIICENLLSSLAFNSLLHAFSQRTVFKHSSVWTLTIPFRIVKWLQCTIPNKCLHTSRGPLMKCCKKWRSYIIWFHWTFHIRWFSKHRKIWLTPNSIDMALNIWSDESTKMEFHLCLEVPNV